MKRIHYFSGITISIFIGFHLVNHFFSIFGIHAHIQLMNDLRIVYRNLIVESILFIAIAIQIITGIKLFLKKYKTTFGFFGRLQIWSGLYLAFFLIFHVGVVLLGRTYLNLDTNFYFGVAGLNTFPYNLFFIPYYGLAIVSFFGHIAAVHEKKMHTRLFNIEPAKQSFLILFIGITLTLVIFYGLTNGFSGVEIPKEYGVLIGK